MGMDSFIATTLNIFPEQIVSILNSWKNKDYETARKTQHELSKAVLAIAKHGRFSKKIMIEISILMKIFFLIKNITTYLIFRQLGRDNEGCNEFCNTSKYGACSITFEGSFFAE